MFDLLQYQQSCDVPLKEIPSQPTTTSIYLSSSWRSSQRRFPFLSNASDIPLPSTVIILVPEKEIKVEMSVIGGEILVLDQPNAWPAC